MDYEQFLTRKQFTASLTGIENPREISPLLFPFQRDVVRWALQRGRAAVFADTGLGKTGIALEWSRHVCEHTSGNVLILAPLAVAQQIVREGTKFGIEARYCRKQEDVAPGITVTNYEMLHMFDPSAFAGVVLDECFAAGTLIDTPSGQRPIESIKVGDEIIGADGVDVVSDVHRREVPFGVKVSFGGHWCIASPNHPFFTQRGWVGAQDLRAGDYTLESSAAVRLVREGVSPDLGWAKSPAFLREILLSEMADEATGDTREDSHAGSRREARSIQKRVAKKWRSGSHQRDRANPRAQSDVATRDARQSLTPIESHGPRTFRTWRERTSYDGTATEIVGGTRAWMGERVELVIGSTDSWLSDCLQSRLRQSRAETRDRGGWQLALCAEGSRPEERREAGFIRVDGIEILELGHPELDRLRDADGKLYFYDLGCTRHPSFSVNGCLVHNSSILKAQDGKTRTRLIEAFRHTPFRLACTATPAPNDHVELGNHAEFLGVMNRTEMLATFFVHDGGSTQDWRLKGHAVEPFWRWVCSWALAIKKPSDIGHDDAGYNLPALDIRHYTVTTDDHDARATGVLFAMPSLTLSEQRRSRRGTLAKRVARGAELVAQEPNEQWLVWCELNDEGDALTEAIPGAVQVAGSDSAETKSERMLAFTDGTIRVLVTKSTVAGFGMNWQHCARQAFVGVSHSYEQFYQSIRRSWRFGQTREVTVHVVSADTDVAIVESLKRKERDAQVMAESMTAAMRETQIANVHQSKRESIEYAPKVQMTIPSWLTSEENAA